MPPNTPICKESMPTTLAIVPSFIAPGSSLPVRDRREWMVVCMTKKAMAADSVAVAFSFSAMPRATPMAKMMGRLSKMTDPTAESSEKIAYGTVPGPMAAVSPYSDSIAALVSDAPTPKSSPAIGRRAMGSMKARPTR